MGDVGEREALDAVVVVNVNCKVELELGLQLVVPHDGELSPADPVVLAPISWSDLQLSLVDLLTVHVHAHTSHDNADEL